MSLFQLFLLYFGFVFVYCIASAAVGALLTYKGFQAAGIADAPVTESGKSDGTKPGGLKPPPRVTFGLCLKVFFAAAFTAFVTMAVVGRFLPTNSFIYAVLSVVVESAFVITLLRRFSPVAMLIVVGSTILTNTITFAMVFFLSPVEEGKPLKLRGANVAASSRRAV
jgi:hypothetical protein